MFWPSWPETIGGHRSRRWPGIDADVGPYVMFQATSRPVNVTQTISWSLASMGCEQRSVSRAMQSHDGQLQRAHTGRGTSGWSRAGRARERRTRRPPRRPGPTHPWFMNNSVLGAQLPRSSSSHARADRQTLFCSAKGTTGTGLAGFGARCGRRAEGSARATAGGRKADERRCWQQSLQRAQKGAGAGSGGRRKAEEARRQTRTERECRARLY